MDISTKFEFNQEVWFEQNGKPNRDWVKLIILQNREENLWIRYELTYYNGWVREVDLFATKEDCENEIARNGKCFITDGLLPTTGVSKRF